MKMATNDVVVGRGGEGEEKKFTIRASSKAFEILSSGLYQDKVGAICRELGTNAADSHVMAGKKDVPFTVHLPNSMEPWFSIRDEGIGLTPERVMSVYTTYFESDKTDSNDVTGCLGLGSKSPFAYTDSFTVTSVIDGTAHHYVAFLSEEKLPSIRAMGSEPTNRPNGVEVKIAVKPQDFGTFKDRAEKIYRWFAVHPTVEGNYQYHPVDQGEALSEGPDWFVPKARRNNVSVVMGNVCYRVEAGHDSIRGIIRDGVESLVGHGFTLRAAIGDVSVTASREGLQYDKKTVKYLRDAFARITNAFAADVQAKIEGASNLWAARVQHKRLATNHVVHQVVQGHKFSWKGKNCHHDITVDLTKHPGVRVVSCWMQKSYKYGQGDRYTFKKDDTGRKVEAGPNAYVFTNDLTTGQYVRLNQYIRSLPADEENNPHVVYLIEGGDKWLADTGLDEVALPVSSLPAVERDTSGVGVAAKKKTAKAVRLTPYYNNGGQGSAWEDTEIDLEAGGVYVEVNRFSWAAGKLAEGDKYEGYIHPQRLSPYVEGLQAFDFSCTDLIGLRKQLADKVKDNPKWVRLDEYGAKLAAGMTPAEVQAVIDGKTWANLGYRNRAVMATADVKSLSPCSKFRQLAERFHHLNAVVQAGKVTKFVQKSSAWAEFGLKADHGKAVEDLTKMAEAMEAAYPLIPALSYGMGSCIDDVVEYVRAMDLAVQLKVRAA